MTNEFLILQLLLNKNGWIKSAEVSSTLNISVRTIRTLIKNINSKNPIIVSSTKGYKLNHEYRDYIKAYLIDNNSFSKETGTSSMRQEFIIKQLLISDNQLNFYDLVDSLYISESTLTNDLSFLRKKLEQYQIVLTRKKDTISIHGEEVSIRKLLSDNIYGEINEGILNLNVLKTVFPEYDVLKIRNCLVESIMENDLSIDDFGITDLVLHLCIMLDRISNNNQINNYSHSFDDETALYSKITHEIFRKIEAITGITIDSGEVFVISPLIAVNTKQLLDKNITLLDLPKFVHPSIIDFVGTLIESVKDSYSINLGNNDFIIRFSLHLGQLLNSIKRSNRNPLLKTIKDSYPLIFELSVFIADLIKKSYPSTIIDDHEISYICLHVGMSLDKETQNKIDAILIIPDYYSLKDTIVRRLNTSFHQKLKIVRIYNDESKVDYTESFDLILSTQYIAVSSDAEFIQITPFINEVDFSNIQYILEIINLKKKKMNSQSLLQLFNESYFKIFNQSDNTKDEIIRELCFMVEQKKMVTSDFVNEVLKREELSPTAYSTLAVPHTLKSIGLNTCIAVGIFPDTMQWGSNSINIVLLLVINENDKDNFKNLFQNVISIFTSKLWIESYRKICTFDDFINLVKNSSK